ncbi:glutathione peroxidase [Flaviaesturariibacter amylovorans]|uniref:Glutathione peroxidase n=1 Tax=Flaviaesturariibacter amylovorans TaxID=1084520 RepID=A0ABP8HUV1_9BACT
MMTFRQRLLRSLYPVYQAVARLTGRHRKVLHREPAVTPPASLYDLELTLSNGERLPLSRFRGRKLLLVNTASNCIYTSHYETLRELEARSIGLAIIAFPANDFKEQEQGSDAEIGAFCRTAFSISFPVARKAPVLPGADQQAVYRWLTDPAQNGWNSQAPTWNFAKYLVDEQGRLTHYFDPAITPDSDAVIQAMERR